ncbi:AI-2E family transporter [Phaeacidiphilus oryzae]|uniref:AI-2E family transporter n=1 Tax=Phaeacidiphilus oryzae TaxID=348818 RepID=UPI00068DB9D5|nr:AI-2E family transporter [Phaeacidiphilus oryzae]
MARLGRWGPIEWGASAVSRTRQAIENRRRRADELLREAERRADEAARAAHAPLPPKPSVPPRPAFPPRPSTPPPGYPYPYPYPEGGGGEAAGTENGATAAAPGGPAGTAGTAGRADGGSGDHGVGRNDQAGAAAGTEHEAVGADAERGAPGDGRARGEARAPAHPESSATTGAAGAGAGAAADAPAAASGGTAGGASVLAPVAGGPAPAGPGNAGPAYAGRGAPGRGETRYPDRPDDPAEAVPWGLRVAASTTWRLLLVAAGLYIVFKVITDLKVVTLAFMAALLISALLQPTVVRLRDAGAPRAVAAATVFLGGLCGIGLVGWFVGWQVSTNLGQVTGHLQTGINQVRGWLIHGPLHLTDTQINQFASQLSKAVGTNSDQITQFGFSTVSIVVEVLTGVVLAAFCTFFLIYDGARIWGWVLRLFPTGARMALAGAGPRAWHTLTSYVRGTVLVAFIDSVCIGIGIYLLGVPLAVPLAVIIFLGAFVPLIGALVTGTIAVLIGLVTHGVFTALMVLVVLIAVQQIEGHVLQPLILGRAVRVHPLAVVLSVATGSVVAGIGGAVVAVPIVAVTNTVVGYLRSRNRVDEEVREALQLAQEDAAAEEETAEDEAAHRRVADAVRRSRRD